MNTTRDRIRAEAAEADRLLAQLQQQPTSDVPPPGDEPPAPPAPPAPIGDEPPAPPAPAPQPTTIEQQLAELQQQYRSLQGNFGTVNANLQAANENNQRLLRLIELRERAEAAPPAPAAPVSLSSVVTDEERTEFGPEFVAWLERMVGGSIAAAVQPLTARFAQLEERLGQVNQQAAYAATTVAKTEEDRFVEALNAAVPTWMSLNQDAGFLTWLRQRDTFSGEFRKVLLEKAAADLDAERAGAFFTAYLRETGRESPAPQGAEVRPQVDLATLVTPTPVAGAPNPSDVPGERIWSQAEVEKVYEDRMRGRMSETDYAVADREIVKALAEGRVR
jgi:hypothetical protein